MNLSKNWSPHTTHGNHDDTFNNGRNLCKIGRRDQVTIETTTIQVYCTDKLFRDDAVYTEVSKYGVESRGTATGAPQT